ncbi:MAG: hypothetical protein GX200_01630 [Firmicutes bacterium]|nr:hypothetical protein [Bacillota bacterium]
MLLTLAKFELKNLLRDKMTSVMIAYPLVLGGIGKYLIASNLVEGQALSIIAMVLTIMAGVAYGAMSGFSLLDDRDDQVFASIQISPVSLNFYIWFKVVFAYCLAVLSGFFIIFLLAVFDLAYAQMLLVAAASALQTPIVAFFINAFANNKVEGFAAMKAAGFITMLPPVAAFFFLDWKEWLFAFSPG